jgi:hypothetical protein
MTFFRRLLAVGACAALLFASIASAEVSVPARLQAQLISKIAAFDRNFVGRAGPTALILVVFKSGDPESNLVAEQVAAELRQQADVGGLPKTVELLAYGGAPSLAATTKDRGAAIVYLSAGLDRDGAAIGTAMRGLDVLTVGASGAHAEKGAVVGFDLEGGRPKIVVNLSAARSQNVAVRSELLRLCRIVG